MSTGREDAHLIDQFLDAIWAERGLSRNTLQSYRYDLEQLAGEILGDEEIRGLGD